MKTHISFKLFISLLCLLSFSEAQWKWQYYKPAGNNYYSINNIDNNVINVRGENNISLVSSNKGLMWETKYDKSIPSLIKIYPFVNNQRIAIGDGGTILLSKDNGNSWQIIYQNSMDAFKKAVIQNSKTIWILSENQNGVLKTSDEGNTWEYIYNDSNKIIKDICFSDSNNGWIIGGHLNPINLKWTNIFMLRTTDGGSTWVDHYPTDFFQLLPTHVSFCDSLHGLLTTIPTSNGVYDNYDFTTSDGGKSWKQIDSVWYLFNSSFIAYPSPGKMFIASKWRKSLFVSLDSGLNWSRKRLGELNDILFDDSLNIYVVGDYGIIKKSINGGVDWINLGSEDNRLFSDVQFLTKKIGFVSSSDIKTTIYKTTDGGENFFDLNIPQSIDPNIAQYRVNSLYFLDTLSGWVTVGIIRGYGSIYKTTNGGLTWINSTGIKSSEPFDIVALDSLHIYSTAGFLRKSTDGGISWNDESIDKNNGLHTISFCNNKVGWVAGYDIIYKTSDGGITWDQQFVDGYPYPHMEHIQAFDDKHAYGVGQNWKFYKTNNGGIDWKVSTVLDSPIGGQSLNDVWFVDTLTGYIAYDYGLLKTTDAGESWKEEDLPSMRRLSKLFFLDKQNGWAVGDNALFRNTNANISGLVINDLPSLTFDLHQNYPNPFNPTTTIEFSLANPGYVKLSVTDYLGREIETLISSNLNAGDHKVIWNARKYSSGVYFYQLTVGNKSEIKKLILLR